MQLHGVDIYLWQEELPEVPKQYENFELTFISNRGTKVYPAPAPDIEMNDWYRCRYLSGQIVTDQEVDSLVQHLSSLGLTWTKCQKLYIDQGVELFSQPY